jgi:hypothetical protein
MRERAQASIEVIALLAAVVAVAAALLLAVAAFGPALAASIGHALSGASGPGTPTAPALDRLESMLLDGATSPGPDGPTLLDLRTQLRSRLGIRSADVALDAILRPLVARTLSEQSVAGALGALALVGREDEDAWLRERFHPGLLSRFREFASSVAGKPGAFMTLIRDAGVEAGEADGIEPGHAAGDLIAELDDGRRRVVLRRRPESGLAIVSNRARLSITGGRP